MAVATPRMITADVMVIALTMNPLTMNPLTMNPLTMNPLTMNPLNVISLNVIPMTMDALAAIAMTVIGVRVAAIGQPEVKMHPTTAIDLARGVDALGMHVRTDRTRDDEFKGQKNEEQLTHWTQFPIAKSWRQHNFTAIKKRSNFTRFPMKNSPVLWNACPPKVGAGVRVADNGGRSL